MSLRSFAIKLAGKEQFHLDDKIGTGYILRMCWKYGCMIIRGRFFSWGYIKIASSIFVGRKVKIYEKKKVLIGIKSKLHDRVLIDALSEYGVIIGDYVVIGHDTIIECTGSLSSIGKGIKIGNRTTFGANCYFGAAGGIEIGEDVVAGQYIRFHSENHNYSDLDSLIKNQGVTHKGIKIGNNCWIGAGSVFLDGAALEDGCVVAANAVVTKHFPQNSVIGGIPARVLKMRTGSAK